MLARVHPIAPPMPFLPVGTRERGAMTEHKLQWEKTSVNGTSYVDSRAFEQKRSWIAA